MLPKVEENQGSIQPALHIKTYKLTTTKLNDKLSKSSIEDHVKITITP